AVLAPDLVVHDHRPLGWGRLEGAASLVDSWKALVELSPDVRVRVDHATISRNASLAVFPLLGTHEGGAFEDQRVVVHEYAANGRIRRHEIYGFDQYVLARARLDELSASAPRDPLEALIRPNAASAAMDRVQASFGARDWAAVRALAAEGAGFEDRRRHARVSGDADWWVANLKLETDESGLGDFQRTLVATAGTGVCLERTLWTGGPADGRVEIEYLWLAEVDAAGRLVAGVMFDVDESRTAIAEASRRWLARDLAAAAVMGPILAQIASWSDRDRVHTRAPLADDLAMDDRRLAGVGRIEGADAYLNAVEALWGLTLRSEGEPRCVLALEPHGAVVVVRTFGTLIEGGAFERCFLLLMTVSRGLITRLEQFEIDAVDTALARLVELRPDPLRIPPNTATRARDEIARCLTARDWEGVRAASFAPGLVWEDRRRLVRTKGDIDLAVASLRVAADLAVEASLTLLATAGERLALFLERWTRSEERGSTEGEVLAVVEVDAEGCAIAIINFDPDDRRAASTELLERLARSCAAPWLVELRERRRALVERDLERLRAALPRDFVFDDHRRVGAGRVGAEEYVAWMASLFEGSPDALVETLYYLAIEPHAGLAVSHNFGTLAEGGAFENVFVSINQPGCLELFEIDDLERAWARFEELRPDETRIPANAASR
ncbi:MAG: hypothetical protein ACREI8_08150, partial [Myxococcota bacterium]